MVDPFPQGEREFNTAEDFESAAATKSAAEIDDQTQSPAAGRRRRDKR